MKRCTLSERRWRRIFREQRAGGQSVAAFCRRAGVSQASFYSWRRRLRNVPRRSADATFVEIKLADPRGVESRAIELRLSCGHGVFVRPGFDRATLRELLATLESSTSAGVGAGEER